MSQKEVVVIDGNSLMHRAFHAVPPTMTAPDGRATNAAFGFISMLLRIVSDFHPDAIICAFDKGKPQFRVDVIEKYKAQRPPTDPQLKEQFPIIQEILTSMNIPVVEFDGWEGDDILGTLSLQGSQAGMKVLLVTGDRDAFQLVDENVSVVSTRKGITDVVIYDPHAVEERYGIPPKTVPDYLGLKGDASDNIPGVPGIGEKTASKLLQEYGSLEGLFAHADEIKGKMGENLRANEDAAYASRTVATIVRDLPLDVDLDSVQFPDFDPAKVRETFHEYSFRSHLTKVLALGDETAAEEEKESRTLGLSDIVSGEAARKLIDDAVKKDEWVGVAFDEGGATSLFATSDSLFVATDAGVASIEPEGSREVLVSLLSRGRVSAIDAKELVQNVIPADSAEEQLIDADDLDPTRIFDAQIAAYLLDSSRATYSPEVLADLFLAAILPDPTNDIPRGAILAALAHKLRPSLMRSLEEDESLSCFEKIELPLLPVLVQMERTGVGLDISVLNELLEETNKQIDSLRQEIYDLAGEEFVIDSPKQLGEVLFVKMGLPTKKKTKTGFSTDASVLEELKSESPIAEKIVSYREYTKLRSTYIEALPKLLGEDKRLHTSFNQTVAATGRLSSSNPNLQNIPVRTEFGKKIRGAFVAGREGYKIVSADYSQVELRVLAHLSQDQGLIEAFTKGEDFHTETASRVFGVPIEQMTPEIRSRAKAINFGIVYGQQAYGLGQSLGIGYGEAQAMIDAYYNTYPKVREYLDHLISEAHRTGYAETMWGRKRRIPELFSKNPNVRSFGDRTAMNHPMQGSAADIIKLAMIEMERRLVDEKFTSTMILQVHDELVFDCPEDEVERLIPVVHDVMVGVVKMDVPLEVEVSSGDNWAEAK